MSKLYAIKKSFFSVDLYEEIKKQFSQVKKKDYKNIKQSFQWLNDEIIKEKNVIKFSEEFTGLSFSKISENTRAYLAVKHGLKDDDTQIHFDNNVYVNIVVPIIMKDLNQSGLIIFPPLSSFFLRAIARYKLTTLIIRKFKLLRRILRCKYFEYKPNCGYIFVGRKLAHGVLYNPKTSSSIRAVVTINFKYF